MYWPEGVTSHADIHAGTVSSELGQLLTLSKHELRDTQGKLCGKYNVMGLHFVYSGTPGLHKVRTLQCVQDTSAFPNAC